MGSPREDPNIERGWRIELNEALTPRDAARDLDAARRGRRSRERARRRPARVRRAAAQPMRSLLTSLGVIIGVSALIVMVHFQPCFTKAHTASLSRPLEKPARTPYEQKALRLEQATFPSYSLARALTF